MRDIIDQIAGWNVDGKRIALATVVSTWGSAPRKAGAHMAVNIDGEMAGSVSGGCVEGAVVEAALNILNNNQLEMLHFGVQDETAWDVGLACGGEIDIFIRVFPPEIIKSAADAVQDNKVLRMATIILGPGSAAGKHILIQGDQQAENAQDRSGIPAEILKTLRELPAKENISIQQIQTEQGEFEILFQSMAPAPTLLVVGGAHIAIALTKMASMMGYRTVVIDPRRAFARIERFGHIDELIQQWPQRALDSILIDANTAVVTLTHDPKIDDPALIAAVRSEAFYVGALGSKKTHEKRRQRLSEAGLDESLIEMIHSPVGLDIGAENPEEIAIAIMAEIITNSRSGGG